MAKKGKQYRDKFGRFAKRGQPAKPPQPRVRGKFVSRPAPLRLGINKKGKRYWIQPRSKRPKKEIVSGGEPIEDIYDDNEYLEEAADVKRGNAPYGYWVEDFLSKSSYPDGYSYVTYHLFVSPKYTGGVSSIVTVRGQQYNTPDEVRDGWKDEVSQLELENQRKAKVDFYIGTIVAVVPTRGDVITHGSVYPEDYHPKERPGTREYEIEEGKRKLESFGPELPKGRRGSKTNS